MSSDSGIGLAAQLEDARKEVDYYKRLASDAGRIRLRETEELSDLISQLKTAKHDLERERLTFQTVVDNAPYALVVISPEGHFLYANPNFLEMFGYSLNEIPMGRDWFRKAYPDDDYRHQVIASWFEDYATSPPGKSRPRIFNVTCKAGEEKTVQFDAVRLPSGEDLMTCEDITRRIKAEREASERYTMISSILENASEGICVSHNVDEYPFVRFTHWNRRMNELTGYTIDDINTLGWYQTMYPDPKLRNMAIDRMARMRVGDNLRNEDWTITTKEREQRIFSISTSVLGGVKGQTHVLAVMRDRTEQKKAEEQLSASEARFRLITEAMADIVWTTDLNLQTTYVSPSIERLLGFTQEERAKQTIEQQVTPESLTKIYELLAEELEREMLQAVDPDRNVIVVTQHYRKDGSTVWLENKVRGLRDSDGTIIGLHGLSRDITERVRAEQEKESLRAQLYQSQRMETIGTLATGIAHDFNNMLQVTLGYSDMLLANKHKGDPEYEELKKIVTTSKEAADLVRRIRIFGGRAEISPVPLDLNHEIAEAMKLLSGSLPTNIEVNVHLTNEPITIHADPSQIGQTLMNLAMNAGEAMPGGGGLTIQTEKVFLDDDYCRRHPGAHSGPHAALTVSDTGRGIDNSLLERIFDPFYTTKMRDYHRGTGLGLSVAQGIVRQHGGHITVESIVGLGATFKVYFPLVEREEPPAPVEREIPLAGGGSETILLVEDEDMVRDLGVAILERHGYSVLTASDGAEGLRVYAKEKENISLVILDIIMPRMDGKECLVELLRINPNVKVLLSTGVAKDALVRDIVDLGAKGSVHKPYSMKHLLAKVRHTISQSNK